MRGKWLLPAAVLCVLLSGCGCEHEWAEAGCTVPKTCIQCGETEGEALSHVQSEPVYSNVDVLAVTADYAVFCERCGEMLESGQTAATRFHDGSKFLFSDPWQWQQRQLELGKEDGIYSYGGVSRDDVPVIQLYYDLDSGMVFASRCLFYNGDAFVYDGTEEMEFTAVKTYLGLNYPIQEALNHPAMALHIIAVMRTCDPSMTQETMAEIFEKLLTDGIAIVNGLSYELYAEEDGTCMTLMIQVAGE